MKKFHVVSYGILLLLILAGSYWASASSKEISNLTDQVNALKAERKDDQKKQKVEISNLKKELRNLKLKLQALQLMNQGLGTVWDSDSSNQIAVPKVDVDLGQESSRAVSSEEILRDPEFAKLVKEEVDKTIAERREKERAERQERYANMMNSWVQRRIDRYAGELKLDDYQKEEFGKIINESSKKMQDMFSNLQSGEVDREQIRTEMDNIRKETDEKVQVVLYPEQYEQYQKMGSALMGSFGRRRR